MTKNEKFSPYDEKLKIAYSIAEDIKSEIKEDNPFLHASEVLLLALRHPRWTEYVEIMREAWDLMDDNYKEKLTIGFRSSQEIH